MNHLISLTVAAIALFSLICSNQPTVSPAQHAGMGAAFKGPVGLQLYSLREQFAKDVPSTLDQVKSFGIENVELAGTYNLSPAEFKKQLDARGLKAISGHFGYEQWRDHFDDVVRDAKTLGLKYAGCAWIPHRDPFDEKTCQEAIAVFNKAGEALAKQGIRFFYHTHGYEFQPHAESTLFDRILAQTNPQYVHFEMDVFWIVHAGQDPVKLLQKYHGRFELMHVKDMKKGTPTGLLTGQSDVRNNVVLGTGVLDWQAIFKAAKQTGVKWYFIEDESPTSVAQIPQSLHFLEQMKF